MISKTCKDEVLSLKVKLEGAKKKEEVLLDVIHEWEVNYPSWGKGCLSKNEYWGNKDQERFKWKFCKRHKETRSDFKYPKALRNQNRYGILKDMGILYWEYKL